MALSSSEVKPESKSALLREASDRASSRGMQVLRTTGVESEAHLPFAGLHQLLRPCLAEIGTLPTPQRSAISAAFGMTDEAAPDIFLIALASLELLGEAAAPSPLVLVVEDAQWLDRPSFDVLTFVGRRLELEPIVLLFAVRDGLDTRFLQAGLLELPLERAGDTAAAALLDAHAPDLAPDVRGRYSTNTRRSVRRRTRRQRFSPSWRVPIGPARTRPAGIEASSRHPGVRARHSSAISWNA